MINPVSEKITSWIIGHKSVVLFLVSIISAFCFWHIRSVEFAGDVSSYVDGSNAEMQSFLAEAELFGSYETYVYVIRADDVLDAGTTRVINSLGASLDLDLDVARYVSITNLPVQVSDDANAGSERRGSILQNPFLSKNFLTPDGRQTQVLAIVDTSEVGEASRLELAHRLRAYAAEHNSTDVRVDVTGPSIVAIDAMAISRKDFERVVWLVPVILGLVVLVVFQAHLIVLAPVLVVAIATLWTIGLFVAAGNKLSMMTALMPVVISVITFADVIHILHTYYAEAAKGASRKSVTIKTMSSMNIACFMTSATTAFGFVSILAVSSISVVKLFTFWTAAGVMFSYVLTISLVPILFSVVRLPGERAQERYRQLPLNRLMGFFYRLSLRPRRAQLLLWLLLPLVFLYGSFRTSVQTDITSFLPAETPSIATFRLLESGVDGVDSLDLMIATEEGSFRDPHQLLILNQLELDLAIAFNEVRSTHSINDAIAGLHGNSTSARYPDDEDDIEEYLLAVELSADDEWLRSFTTVDFASVRVAVRIEHDDSRTTLALIESIDAWLADNGPENWRIASTGALKLLVVNVQALIDSQLLSFLVALIVITLAIFLFVRNWALSGLSLIVNTIPVLLALGFFPLLAWAGLFGAQDASLNISTVMVPSLAMAIAVDDTIHFLFRYRTALRANSSVKLAVEKALNGAGFAMTVTTIAMVSGFSVLMFSEIAANQEFATMMCVALVTALLADLILLPQLICMWMTPRHA
jgi:predicted RND superfamily exporter protein